MSGMTGLEEAAAGGSSGEGARVWFLLFSRFLLALGRHLPLCRDAEVPDCRCPRSNLTGLADEALCGLAFAFCPPMTGGHYYSLLKGVCAGFFVPFLPLFFFRTQIFSKRCVRFIRSCLRPEGASTRVQP